MKNKFIKSVITTLAMTAVIGTQVLCVSAAPATTTAVSPISKDVLLTYYNENFDVEAYKKTYPDLVAAFGENADKSVYLNHYLENGMKEGRKAGGFDAIAFIINNYDYFMEHGLDADFPFFNAEKYKAAYPDLAAAFGNDMSLYLQHYLTNGIFENRSSEAQVDLIVFENEHPDTDIRPNVDIAKLKTEIVTVMFETAHTVIVPTPEETGSTEDLIEVAIPTATVNDHIFAETSTVVYDHTAYNAAYAAWKKSQPNYSKYLESTSYYEDCRKWESSEPDITQYLTEEGQRIRNEWLAERPDYWTYLMQTAYKDIYDEWYESSPQREDYKVGYTSEETAKEAFESDHAAWESGMPKATDYPDYTSWAEARDAHYAIEPKEEDYPYFEDGYTDEDVARQAYQNAHNTWEEGVPARQDYEAEFAAYVAENPEPQLEDYNCNYYASQELANAALENDHKVWEDSKPVRENYEDDDSYNAALAEYLANNHEPQATDSKYIFNENWETDGWYENSSKACEAYNTDHNSWSASAPVKEEERDYQLRVERYEQDNPEPIEEDYTGKVNTYESQEAATAKYNEVHEAWEADMPVQKDYVDEEAYNAAVKEYCEEHPEPKITDDAYALGYATQEEADEAYNAASDEYRQTQPSPDGYIEQTNFYEACEEWNQSSPDLSDELVPDGEGNNYEDLKNAWLEDKPKAEDYIKDTTYDEDLAKWFDEAPQMKDFKK